MLLLLRLIVRDTRSERTHGSVFKDVWPVNCFSVFESRRDTFLLPIGSYSGYLVFDPSQP
jgi:hypothetical protein